MLTRGTVRTVPLAARPNGGQLLQNVFPAILNIDTLVGLWHCTSVECINVVGGVLMGNVMAMRDRNSMYVGRATERSDDGDDRAGGNLQAGSVVELRLKLQAIVLVGEIGLDALYSVIGNGGYNRR